MNLRQPIAEAVGICVAVSLILFLYAWSEHPLSWGNFVIQQSDLKKFLTFHPPTKKEKKVKNEVTLKKEIPTDTTVQKVLLVGDSMVQELELAFAPICAHNHFEFQSIALQSSGILFYAQSDTLAKAIKAFDPTLVIIVLGSNELTIPDVEARRPHVEKILEVVGERKVVWVGPPNWRKDTGMNDFLAEMIEEDRYFKSANLTFKRKTDGIHPTMASSFAWTDSIAYWLQHRSRYRIRLDQTKDDSLSKVLLKKTNERIYRARMIQQYRNKERYRLDSLRKSLIEQPKVSDSLPPSNLKSF